MEEKGDLCKEIKPLPFSEPNPAYLELLEWKDRMEREVYGDCLPTSLMTGRGDA